MPAYLRPSNGVASISLAPKGTPGVPTRNVRNRAAGDGEIIIGLVNNMPDGALESTERQFVSLLDAASGNRQVSLRLFSMSDIRRRNSAANRVRTFYSGVENLWNTKLDGIIVTGREPVRARLSDEAYWGSFKMLVDWAKERTCSAVWSCLAAHAAVLHCDGIDRCRSESKRCGIFVCSRAEEHFLTAGLPISFRLPHSRWNGVSETALRSSGYQVLSQSEVGPDIFIKQYQSLFVFFQGHPEYESDTLMLEYRRDVGRFLKGESKVYPSLPNRYFDEEMVASLEAFREEAIRCPRRELLENLQRLLLNARTEAPWRTDAIQIFRNWMEYIVAQREPHLFVKNNWNNMSVVPIRACNSSLSSGYLEKKISGQGHPNRIAGVR